MTVAVHNPSTLDLKNAQILVPHGNYEVQVFDKDLKLTYMILELFGAKSKLIKPRLIKTR